MCGEITSAREGAEHVQWRALKNHGAEFSERTKGLLVPTAEEGPGGRVLFNGSLTSGTMRQAGAGEDKGAVWDHSFAGAEI